MLTNSEWACTIIRTFIYVQNGIEIKKKKTANKKNETINGSGWGGVVGGLVDNPSGHVPNQN